MTSTTFVEESQARSPTRFLVELENACAALRLYGESHPVFKRNAGQAASALSAAASFSISPQGFISADPAEASPKKPGPAGSTLADGVDLARRLRALGLIGLRAQPPVTGAQVEALVRVICEAEREHLPAAALEQKISAASGQHIKVVPLRLGNLHLVQGPATNESHAGSSLWRDLFHQACGTGGGPSSGQVGAAGLARAFESTANSARTPGDWRDIVENWKQTLDDITGAATPHPAGASKQRLELVSGFLQQLEPALRQRLLADTLSAQNIPQPLVLEVAARLPQEVILDALAAVARDDRQPSSAALALLRKVSAGAARNATQDGSSTAENTIRLASAVGTRAGSAPTGEVGSDKADFAATVQQLLASKHEESFVPADYLSRRQELSATQLAPRSPSSALQAPSERETAHHAARLVFRILSEASQPEHLAGALGYVKERIHDWVREGQLDLAGEALAAAQPLCGDVDAQVAISAKSVIEEIVLSVSQKPRQAIASLIASAGEQQTLAFIEKILPFTAGSQRRELLEALFARNVRWPLPLTESLLKDPSPMVRRLAVMRLTRDHDVAVAASVFRAASRGNAYAVDVAQCLADLLRPSAGHPQVRSAYKAWRWSGRRWMVLLCPTLSGRRDAA